MPGLVLSCEHASWTLPPGIDLGVPLDVLRSQASWDHGALDIATRLSEAVGLPVHAGAFSRMFVDLNRHAGHPDVVPEVSYGAVVPIILGTLALRRALPVGSRWVAAGIGAAGGSLGGLVLHLHCPIADGVHVGLVHGGVIAIAALLAAALMPRAIEVR